jgi:hypothetical protein
MGAHGPGMGCELLLDTTTAVVLYLGSVRDVTIVNLPLPSTTRPVLLVELVPVST